MSEQSGEKTEKPTQKKLKDAREEGQIAQSRNLTMAFAIVTITFYFLFTHTRIANILQQAYISIYFLIGSNNIDGVALQSGFSTILHATLLIMMPAIGLAAVVSSFACLMQIGGFMFSTKAAFKFDFKKFNPIGNLKNLFSKKTLIKFVMNNVQILVLTLVAIYLIKSWLHDILLVSSYSLENIVTFLLFILIKLLIILLVISLVFAFIDVLSEKIAMFKQLMMTKEEITQEYKNSEGNPEVKGERKRMHEEIMEEDAGTGALKNSTFVLANPTHIAIVIIYLPKKFVRPMIGIVAVDKKAEMIFKIAKKINLPIIQNQALARSMYPIVKSGDFVPLRFLQDVADIISKNIKLFPKVMLELKETLKAKTDTNAPIAPTAKVIHDAIKTINNNPTNKIHRTKSSSASRDKLPL